MWYWSVHVCVWMAGMWDPSPPSGLAGGDIGDRLQDDVRRRRIQPQAAPTGRPGGSGLPHTFLQHCPVDRSSQFLLLFTSRWLWMFSAGSLFITSLKIRSVASRFLFPGLPDDGGIIPEPPASKGRHDSNTAEQGWESTHTEQKWLETVLLSAFPSRLSSSSTPVVQQCAGGELLLSAPPSAAPSTLPTSLHPVLPAGGAGGGAVLGPHPPTQQTARPVAAQLPGSAGVSVNTFTWTTWSAEWNILDAVVDEHLYKCV